MTRTLDDLRLAIPRQGGVAYLILEDQVCEFEDHRIETVSQINLTAALLATFLDDEINSEGPSEAEGMYERLLRCLLATIGEYQVLAVLIEIYQSGGLIEVEC